MTESDWLRADDPEPLLAYLRRRGSDRKLRLFACACCRRVWNLLADGRSRAGVVMAEQFAEGLVGEDERVAAYELARAAGEMTAWATTWSFAWRAAAEGPRSAADLVAGHAFSTAAQAAERREQADLLRHIFGNPFRPQANPGRWPDAVTRLAESLHAGAECDYALADALLEAGHPELAEHFRARTVHPGGCWAIDLILGKS